MAVVIEGQLLDHSVERKFLPSVWLRKKIPLSDVVLWSHAMVDKRKLNRVKFLA